MMSFDLDAIRKATKDIDLEVIRLAWIHGKAEGLYEALLECSNLAEWKAYLEANPPSPKALAIPLLLGVEFLQSAKGRNAANKLHGKPGGSRDKADEIRRIWATGKFVSRNYCAEQEYEALGLSRETARKHLRNTPNPNPWPAKNPAKKKT